MTIKNVYLLLTVSVKYSHGCGFSFYNHTEAKNETTDFKHKFTHMAVGRSFVVVFGGAGAGGYEGDTIMQSDLTNYNRSRNSI